MCNILNSRVSVINIELVFASTIPTESPNLWMKISEFSIFEAVISIYLFVHICL